VTSCVWRPTLVLPHRFCDRSDKFAEVDGWQHVILEVVAFCSK
jgi:hypothetical protein